MKMFHVSAKDGMCKANHVFSDDLRHAVDIASEKSDRTG
jgi:hypothetical protein